MQQINHLEDPAIMKNVILSLAVVLLCLASYEGSTVNAQDQSHAIEVHARRFSFTPGTITVTKGEPVTLSVTADDTTHGLSIPELGVNATFNKGKATTVSFTPKEAGTFEGKCNHFCGVGHGTMVFTVEVKDK
jgi:cytochrome c oxidase subunit II